MKLLRLNLIAFGPFTNRSIELSGEPGRLEIVLGANEAGKSTSLRALEGLLFGIDQRSSDAHLHPYADLRVGGVLVGQNGETLEIVRRKGLKGTLRDASDEIIDDALLKRMLRGVDADAFRALYGLNHETLRLGADALEKAQGKVGESLFDAGLGGLGVGPAIAALGTEADDLFTPQARKKPLNEAIRALVETRKQVRIASVDPDAPAAQENGIVSERTVVQEAEAERKSLSLEHARLSRLMRAAPLIDARRGLIDARSTLGEVVLLADNASSEREQATNDKLDAGVKLSRVNEEMAKLVARRDTIDAPLSLLAMASDIERLGDRANVAYAAAEERASHQRDALAFERSITELEKRVGAHVMLSVDSELGVRVSEMGVSRDTNARRKSDLERDRFDLEASRKRIAEELEALPKALFDKNLEAVIEEGTRLAELPRQIAADEAEVSASGARIDAELSSLGLFSGAASQLVALKVPPLELCVATERAERERSERKRASLKTSALFEEQTRALGREVDALLRSGAVPSVAELDTIRRRRDQLLLRLKTSRDLNEASLEELAELIEGADSIADRLRREASRIERHAQLTLAATDAQSGLTHERAVGAALIEEDLRAHEAWAKAWEPSGIEPLGATEMRSWLERRRAIVDMWLGREARIERARTAQKRVEEVAAALDRSADQGDAARRSEEPTRVSTDPESLQRSLARAKQVLASNERAQARREALETQLAETSLKIERGAHEARELSSNEEELARSWSEAMALLGLDASASSTKAATRQADLSELGRARDDLARVEAQLERIDVREKELRRSLDAVLDACRSDLGAIDASDAVQAAFAVAKRFAAARAGDAERKSLDGRIAGLEADATEAQDRVLRAEKKLAELARAARAPESELASAEARSREALRLDREIETLEQELRGYAEGGSIAELETERASLVGTEVSVRRDELLEQIQLSEERRDRAHHQIGALTEGLRKMENETKAADLAVTAEGHLARAALLLRRHAVARLAKVVLEREVERYRQSHQGPIVDRAAELLRKLTLGRYENLRVVYGENEAPELRCVRGGREVEVAGLSDGTRDQLFLALRLATLERHATFGEPMPLVLDDVFVHFDDERTRAGLEVLAELSSVVQVLLFTHHHRVVELAEREPRISFGLSKL